MPIVIVGAGRSGTNMALEIMRGNPWFDASEPEEDKRFFSKKIEYPENYLTKCDTHYIKPADIYETIIRNPHLKIIFTIRDPRDMILSKMYRGRAGGDRPEPAEDATEKGVLEDFIQMMIVYEELSLYVDNFLVMRMEDMLDNTIDMARNMACFTDTAFVPGMDEFWRRMRNKKKAERYHCKDISQIAMWKRVDEIYDKYFCVTRVRMLFDKVKHITEKFHYA